MNTIKFNGGKFKIDEISYKKRTFYDLEGLFDIILKDDTKTRREILKLIPKVYIKTFERDGVKRKYIDVVALGYLFNYDNVNDYDFYKCCIERTTTSFRKYKVDLFNDITNLLIGSISQLGELSDKIGVMDSIQQDLLHELENNVFLTAKEKENIADELQKARINRREFKNKYAELTSIRDFLKSTKLDKNNLNQFIQRINKYRYISTNKIYNERTTEEGKELWKQQLNKFKK